jgi:hypothetical protein
MRQDPLAAVSLAATPQTQPIPGTAQVRNAASGYVFAKDQWNQWNQVEDFLILGTVRRDRRRRAARRRPHHRDRRRQAGACAEAAPVPVRRLRREG